MQIGPKHRILNLIRYKPSGNYFGRVRVNGKLIRRSLETYVLTVAKLKRSDFLKDHRRLAINKGESVLGEGHLEFRLHIVLIAIDYFSCESTTPRCCSCLSRYLSSGASSHAVNQMLPSI
jgi:hypothetical protein